MITNSDALSTFLTDKISHLITPLRHFHIPDIKSFTFSDTSPAEKYSCLFYCRSQLDTLIPVKYVTKFYSCFYMPVIGLMGRTEHPTFDLSHTFDCQCRTNDQNGRSVALPVSGSTDGPLALLAGGSTQASGGANICRHLPGVFSFLPPSPEVTCQ